MAQRPTTVKTAKVLLKVKLRNDSYIQLDANVVPKITGPIQRRPIKIYIGKNMRYLWKNVQLADTLPTSLESSSIEILVGNNYYFGIFLLEKVKIQSGLY